MPHPKAHYGENRQGRTPKPDAPTKPRKQPERLERQRQQRAAGAVKAEQCSLCGGVDEVLLIKRWSGPWETGKREAVCRACRDTKLGNRFRFVREGE